MLAKVEVAPITAITPGYKPVEEFLSVEYHERLASVRCVAWFFANSDIVIYVPPEVPKFAFIAAEHIERDAVQTILQGEEREGLLSMLPPQGITIRFDDVA